MKSIIVTLGIIGVLAFLYSCKQNKKCQTKDMESNEVITEKNEDNTKSESRMNSVLNDIYGVTKVNELPISPTVGITMEFHLNDGKLMGNGGCNKYGGKLAWDGKVLKISQVMATKMACQNLPLEKAFFQAMEKVDGYQTKKGVLLLTVNGVPVIEARRMD